MNTLLLIKLSLLGSLSSGLGHQDALQERARAFAAATKNLAQLEKARDWNTARGEAVRLESQFPEFTASVRLHVAAYDLLEWKLDDCEKVLASYENQNELLIAAPRAWLAAHAGRDPQLSVTTLRKVAADKYDPRYEPDRYLPTRTDSRTVEFLAALVASDEGQLIPALEDWFLRRAEDIYPDNPILCDKLSIRIGATGNDTGALEYVNRGIAGSSGRLRDSLQKRKIALEHAIRWKREHGG